MLWKVLSEHMVPRFCEGGSDPTHLKMCIKSQDHDQIDDSMAAKEG